jgi:hypothetical protein
MKLLRPLFLTAMSVFIFYIPSACPPIYVMLNAYVQFPGTNFTSSELGELNLSDIKDTSNQAIPNKIVNSYYAEYSRVGDVKRTSVGSSYNFKLETQVPVQEAYKKMMDTLLPQLNMTDTVFVRYYLNNDGSKKLDNKEIFYYGRFERFMVAKTYVISSQAVVDLKRSPEDAGMIAYPSPAVEHVSVKFEVKEPIAGHITLSNSLGQIIAETDHENLMQPFTFNISEEAAGTYFIRAQIDGEYFTKKFVKE